MTVYQSREVTVVRREVTIVRREGVRGALGVRGARRVRGLRVGDSGTWKISSL